MPRRSELFVFRLDYDTSVDDVKQYLEGKGVSVHSVNRMSREESVYSSFKVSVDTSSVSSIMDEEFCAGERQQVDFKSVNTENHYSIHHGRVHYS